MRDGTKPPVPHRFESCTRSTLSASCSAMTLRSGSVRSDTSAAAIPQLVRVATMAALLDDTAMTIDDNKHVVRRFIDALPTDADREHSRGAATARSPCGAYRAESGTGDGGAVVIDQPGVEA